MKQCPKCNTQHEKPGSCCSRTCANSRGPRTEAFKKNVSAKLTGREISPATIEKISGDNHHTRKGRNFPEFVMKECLYCGAEFRSRGVTRNFCSRDCQLDHFKEIRSEWEQYSLMCKFAFDVYRYPEWFDLALANTHGWYKAKNKGNNLTGVSRDHMFSVKAGFLAGVDPKLISHPANCQLMQHSMNSAKKTQCSITSEELTERINKFNKQYVHVAERPNASDCKPENPSVQI